MALGLGLSAPAICRSRTWAEARRRSSRACTGPNGCTPAWLAGPTGWRTSSGVASSGFNRLAVEIELAPFFGRGGDQVELTVGRRTERHRLLDDWHTVRVPVTERHRRPRRRHPFRRAPLHRAIPARSGVRLDRVSLVNGVPHRVPVPDPAWFSLAILTAMGALAWRTGLWLAADHRDRMARRVRRGVRSRALRGVARWPRVVAVVERPPAPRWRRGPCRGAGGHAPSDRFLLPIRRSRRRHGVRDDSGWPTRSSPRGTSSMCSASTPGKPWRSSSTRWLAPSGLPTCGDRTTNTGPSPAVSSRSRARTSRTGITGGSSRPCRSSRRFRWGSSRSMCTARRVSWRVQPSVLVASAALICATSHWENWLRGFSVHILFGALGPTVALLVLCQRSPGWTSLAMAVAAAIIGQLSFGAALLVWPIGAAGDRPATAGRLASPRCRMAHRRARRGRAAISRDSTCIRTPSPTRTWRVPSRGGVGSLPVSWSRWPCRCITRRACSSSGFADAAAARSWRPQRSRWRSGQGSSCCDGGRTRVVSRPGCSRPRSRPSDWPPVCSWRRVACRADCW